MNKKLQYILLSLLLLIAGIGEGMAETIDGELNDKYYTSIGSRTETPKIGQWYCIQAFDNSSNSSNTDKYLQGNSKKLVAPPSQNGQAVLDASKFFKIESVSTDASGNVTSFKIISGDGYCLQITNDDFSWVNSTSSATNITYTSQYNIRTTSLITNEKYGYLYFSGTSLLADTHKREEYDGDSYRFYFLPVTFTTKYEVKYNFQYDTPAKTVSTSELVVKNESPTYHTEAQLNELLKENFSYVYADYQVDGSQIPSDITSAITAAREFTIPLKTRETLIDQDLSYNTPIAIFEGETKDLDNYIISKTTGATITYSIKDGTNSNGSITLTGTKVQGEKAGSATVIASSAAFDKYNAATVEIPITVTGYTDIQKAFIHAYDSLAAYQDKIGIRLGQYTYKKNSTSINDNAEFTDMIFAYINQRNDVRSYTDRDLQTATKAIWTLKDDMEGTRLTPVAIKLSLNLPTPGTLLKMKTTVTDAEYIGAGDNKILYFFDPANTKDNTTKGNLVTYDTGYYLTSGDAISSTVNDASKQEYTFTAKNVDKLDAIYAANSSTYYLEDVDNLPVTIGEYGYATLYTPAALQIPNALKAYIATAQSGINLTLTRIRGIVPRGTALVLVGPAGTYDFPVDRSTTDAAPESPLKGTYPVITTASVGSDVSKTVYTLQPYTASGASTYSNVAFYPYSGTGKENVTHFKCYFTSPASEVKAFTITFDDEEVDGILELKAESGKQKAESGVYDLQGRCLGTSLQDLPHGLYIIGGKKVVK